METNLTTNKTLLDWLDEKVELLKPSKIVWIDGSKEQIDALKAEAVETGEMIKLNEDLLPDCYLHRTAENDVARVEDRTLICTKNEKDFGAKLKKPEDAPWGYSCVGKFGNVAKRRVNTIFDHDISPESNMVLGEVLIDSGNWSGYLPHSHPQPETYFFKFDHPEGFGASFVGDQVFKSTDESYSAIPGGELHPQAVAPGYQMYTCWMIRHIDGNPWLQTDRCEDERYTWLHDAEF